jgi:hypothetical protein
MAGGLLERSAHFRVLKAMDRMKTTAALASALALAACGQPGARQNEQPDPAIAPATEAAVTVAAPAARPAGANAAAADGAPDLAPPRLTPEAERGEKGARNVLLSFARAIELRDYGQAWALLSPADQRKWPEAQFAALFADLGKASVAIPAGTMEGAAGSSFYTAPVTITGEDTDGRPVRLAGEAVLRRVNDVDGATPAQLRWHFERLTLDWEH